MTVGEYFRDLARCAQRHGVVVGKLDALKIAKLTGDIPQNMNFAIKGGVVRDFLDAHGINYLVGYGHIGTQIGLLAKAMGMPVAFYDIETKFALGNARPASLDDVLAQSDVLTLHVPETPATKGPVAVPQSRSHELCC